MTRRRGRREALVALLEPKDGRSGEPIVFEPLPDGRVRVRRDG
jgi:hypothetical protein